MNQYITLLFSLLAEFFLPPRTQPPGAGDRPPRSPACPRAWSQRGAGFPRLARLEAGDCSSGSPEPERRMARRTSSGPVARGPVPRERSLSENRTPTQAVFRADRSIARDRPSPYGKRHAFFTVARGFVPRDHTREKNLFRSFRSCMSIVTPTKKTHAAPGRFLDLGTARDRPSPYGGRETALQTVARGPVPRERQTRAKNARSPRPPFRSRHVAGQALALR